MIDFITDPGGWINGMFHKICLLIDGVLCWSISQVYQIFIKLADARIFEDSFFSNFAKRIYAILGVFMLFYLAYSLLNMLIEPDKTTGDKGIGKMASNVVISLVILGLLPTIFDYAYKIQAIIFKENVIGAIVFGTSTNSNDDSIKKYGNYMAYAVINPFLNPANYNVRLRNNYSWFDLKADIIEKGEFTNLTTMSNWAIEAQPLISPTYNNDDTVNLAEGTMVTPSYKPIISWICEGAVLYIIFTFCLDLGVRVVKFAFCQLIAPIPVVMRIIPSKKGTFDKWLKLTLTVYAEVFIRVAIMYLVIYFFSAIANLDMFKYATSGVQGLIVLVILLMGLLTFAKQAPKLISETLGLDVGNIDLGFKNKLKAGGFFAAGSMFGAGATMLSQNLYRGGRRFVNNWRQNWETARNNYAQHMEQARINDNNWDTIGNIKERILAGASYLRVGTGAIRDTISTASSGVAGATSGVVHAKKDGKNFGDMRTGAQAGVEVATRNRENREYYRSTHGNSVTGSVLGHLTDIRDTAREWATGSKLSAQLSPAEQRLMDVLEEFSGKVKSMESLWKDEKAYIDAEAANRNAQVQHQVANRNLNALSGATSSDFINYLKSQIQANPNMSSSNADIKSLMRDSYEHFKNSGASTELLDAMKNNQNAVASSLKQFIDSGKVASNAQATLDETVNYIKSQKAVAIESFGRQLDAIRENYSEYAEFIGRAGEGSTVSTKSNYVNEINRLNLKVDSIAAQRNKK